jgi:thioredoxin 1
MGCNRRAAMMGAVAGLALWGWLPAVALAEPAGYSAQAFEAAQAAGKPILVHVTAPWCGTCRAQKPIVSRLGGEPDFSSYVMFNVDFDTQKDALKRFGVRHQTTMIVFRGRDEIGRSLGDTNPASIETLLRKAL